jgi:recombinational DNA repair ATPase RecF
VEEELVILCVMVMQGVDVKWELIEQWTKVLMDEILSRLNPQQQELLLPYAQKMQQAFLDKRVEFGAINKLAVIAK